MSELPLALQGKLLRVLEAREFGVGFAAGETYQMRPYSWPGNVRELEHAIQRSAFVCDAPSLPLGVLSDAPFRAAMPEAPRSRSRFRERSDARGRATAAHPDALKRTGFRIAGSAGAAALPSVHPNTLRCRMQKLGIRRGS